MKTSLKFLILFFFTTVVVYGTQKAYTCKVVDYGSDMGFGYYRDLATTAQTTYTEDVDGDGLTTDDCIAFWKFSLTEPMTPSVITYDKFATNSKFYGGITAFFNSTKQGMTEGMINTNHELRDDWNLMSVHSVASLQERAYGFWFWDKADFLNGGNQNTVTFDSNSRISVGNFRLSTNFPDGRWVVRDGNQFYISEAKFGTTLYTGTTQATITKYSNQTLSPTTTRWALYNPVEPYDIRFKNPASAVFENHTFTNVTAIGFYVARDLLSTGNTQLKWHAFEVTANVTREEAPSFYTEMAQISAGNPFYISKKEIDYNFWQKVYRWAVSNQYLLGNTGYVFDKDGDMGSMDADDAVHSAFEPVTDITWYDAVVWCNALSEMEGLSACYYADAAKTIPLKTIKDRTDSTKYSTKFPIYVDYTKNGYRLPTLGEWTTAAAEASSSTANAWIATNSEARTHTCGQKLPNSLGVYDMVGNVWEYCWDTNSAGDYFNPNSQTSHTVIGGSYNYPDNTTIPLKKWGDIPSKGNPNIGFRIVRSDSQGNPSTSQSTNALPVWTINENAKVLPATTPTKVSNILTADLVKISGTKVYKSVGDPLYENDNTGFIRTDDAVITVTPYYMSKYETSYSKWREILNWAEMNGYTFDGDGDMGCMDYKAGSLWHNVNEPATETNWNDVMLWCNALSEYEGKAPVYYSDAERTMIMRKGLQWRIAMEQRYSGYPTYTNNAIHARYEKDGYRLPTEAEWEVAYRSGVETKSYGIPTNAGTNSFVKTNSGDSTHVVTSGTANSLGIYNLGGNVSEWINGAQGYDYYHNHNPKDADDEGLFGITVKGGNFGSDAPKATDIYTEKASAPRSFEGFRVVRCDLNEHPETEVFVPDTKIVFNKKDFNPLTGRTFRNNLMRTGEFNKSGVPTSSIITKWTFTTGAAISSSPVIVNGVLYVGSDDKYIYAIDANTGVQKWRYLTGNFVRSSATVVSDSLYIGSNDGYLYCLNATSGTLYWRKKAYTSGSVKASPVVLYNTVFATWHGMFEVTNTVGLDKKTGTVEKWRYRGSRINEGAIAADSTSLYFAASDNMISSCDIATEMNIFYKTGDHNKGSMVILDDNTVLYTVETNIKAIDKKTGATKWTKTVGTDTDASPLSSPAVATVDINGVPQKVIFFATLKKTVIAYDVNGNALWTQTFPAAFNSAPVVANNVVYVGCDNNVFYALNASTGSTIWSQTTGGTILCSPWVEDNAVYFSSSDGKVYSIAVDSLTSISQRSMMDVSVYPNPVASKIRISCADRPTMVRISNLMGQVVLIANQGDLNLIDVSQLKQGTYSVEVLSKNNLVGKRLFVKK